MTRTTCAFSVSNGTGSWKDARQDTTPTKRTTSTKRTCARAELVISAKDHITLHALSREAVKGGRKGGKYLEVIRRTFGAGLSTIYVKKGESRDGMVQLPMVDGYWATRDTVVR
jgi:hypothetical protein